MFLGPIFSNHVWSTIWLAIFCPKIKLSLGADRCTSDGKKPSILEKLCKGMFGVILNCLDVRDASSRARSSPRPETRRALNFRVRGIVMIGVLVGRTYEVIRNPAMMLPQASRFNGLITRGLFSSMGEIAGKRG